MKDNLMDVTQIAMTLGVSVVYVYQLIKNDSPLVRGVKKIGRSYKIAQSRLFANLGMKWDND